MFITFPSVSLPATWTGAEKPQHSLAGDANCQPTRIAREREFLVLLLNQPWISDITQNFAEPANEENDYIVLQELKLKWTLITHLKRCEMCRFIWIHGEDYYC